MCNGVESTGTITPIAIASIAAAVATVLTFYVSTSGLRPETLELWLVMFWVVVDTVTRRFARR